MSCPASCRASTFSRSRKLQNVDGRDKPGHDERVSTNKTAPEGPGAAQRFAEDLFQALGGFLNEAEIGVLLDVDLLFHEAEVARRIDVALQGFEVRQQIRIAI